jgi:hypothetical protein
MNVEIGTEAPIFLFWEYLFRNFSILSLQCVLNSLLGEAYGSSLVTTRGTKVPHQTSPGPSSTKTGTSTSYSPLIKQFGYNVKRNGGHIFSALYINNYAEGKYSMYKQMPWRDSFKPHQ